MPKKNGNGHGPAAMPAFTTQEVSLRHIAATLKRCKPVFVDGTPGEAGFCDGIYERPDGDLVLLDRVGPQHLLYECLPGQAYQWFAIHNCFADLGGDEAAQIRFHGQIARLMVLK